MIDVPSQGRAISVITVNYKSKTLINELERLFSDAPVEYIVVDNSGDFVAARPETKVVEAPGNIGFGRACNLGVENSDGDVVVFANPDIGLTAEALSRFLADCQVQPEHAVWAPLIRDRRGQVVTLLKPGWAGLAFRRRPLDRKALSGETVPVVYVSGAFFAVHRQLFLELGGFSSTVFLYGEDLDLCLRAEALGSPVFLLTSVEVRHSGGGSSGILERYRRFFRGISGHYAVFRGLGWGRAYSLLNAVHLSTGRRF